MDNLIATLIAAVGTMLAGLITQLLSTRRRRELQQHREELERLAGVVNTEESARKAAVLERVVERIPIGLTPKQFESLIAEITSRVPSSPDANLTTAGAVETLITNYHEQALTQAKAQFWFSVAAATVGFGWILWAGSGIDPANTATVAKTIPGIVMDAVAFLFFKQASETRQRATELYDRLRRDKQMSESAAIVSSIEDVRLRSAVKAQLALHMSGLQPSPIDLSIFLSGESAISGNNAQAKPQTRQADVVGG